MSNNCSICDEILDNSHNQVVLGTCDHVFHTVCMVRWLEKFPEQRSACPQCLGAMNISQLRLIQLNSNRNLGSKTQPNGEKSKRLALGKCGIEFNNYPLIIANLELEYAELQKEKQRLDDEKRRLDEEIWRLKEESRRIKEEKERLEQEKRRLDEEKQRLERQIRRLQERARFENVLAIALLMALFIGLYLCFKFTFRCTLM